jgi:hypothetical protein
MLALAIAQAVGLYRKSMAQQVETMNDRNTQRRRTRPFPYINQLIGFVALMFAFLIGLVTAVVILPYSLKPEALSSVASTIFQVCGTFVALLLPTAQLAGDRVTGYVNAWVKLVRSRDHIPFVLRSFNELERVISISWIGCLFIVCAFLLSTVELFTPGVPAIYPFITKTTPSQLSPLDISLISWTLAFLLVGFALLLPFIRFLYSFGALDRDQFIEMLNVRADSIGETGSDGAE